MKEQYLDGKKLYLSELMKKVSKEKSVNRRVGMLQEYAKRSDSNYKTLQMFAEATWHPMVVMDLPEGKVPYREEDMPDDPSFGHSDLSKALYKVSRMVQGTADYIPKRLNRENLFIRELERMHKDEAELFIMVKDKKIKYPYITKKLFQKAFPDWNLGE